MGSCHQCSSSYAAAEALTLRLHALRVEVEGHLWQQQQQQFLAEQFSSELHALQTKPSTLFTPQPSAAPHAS